MGNRSSSLIPVDHSPFDSLRAVTCPRSDCLRIGRSFTCPVRRAVIGPDAEGVALLGKNLHDNEFVSSLSDAELVAFLAEGRLATHPLNERRVAMPPRGGNPSLSDEDLGSIADYLRSIQR